MIAVPVTFKWMYQLDCKEMYTQILIFRELIFIHMTHSEIQCVAVRSDVFDRYVNLYMVYNAKKVNCRHPLFVSVTSYPSSLPSC